MEDDKSTPSADDFDELAGKAWEFAFKRSGDSKVLQAFAILTESTERLKRETEENREAIDKLRASTERSSNEANGLSTAIKKLNAWLVGLTVAAVALAAVSLFVLWKSIR